MDFNPDTWGTVADWVGGLGTTAAFLITGFVVYRDAKLRRSAQARQVAYYVRRPKDYLFDRLSGRDVQEDYFVSNMSPEPIYDVIWYYKSDENSLGLLDHKGVLLPSQEHPFPEIEHSLDEPPLICFRDNSGNLWIRSVAGYFHPAKQKWMDAQLPDGFNRSAPGLGLW